MRGKGVESTKHLIHPTHTHIHTHTHTERERERDTHIHTHTHTRTLIRNDNNNNIITLSYYTGQKFLLPWGSVGTNLKKRQM